MAKFVAKLREISEHCEFGDRLDKHLRDQLVCGIADECAKQRLFMDTALMFQKAMDIARGMKTARKNVEAVHSTVPQTMRGKNTSGP